MPIDSIGIDVKMSLDMDPKTYSPMSGSDENMSSPPSVLTAAGSCTPSSLPSAGSTPSSIPSAGSTPYQFVSQEESTIIKPLTLSDHQSVHPATPDQPITPEPTVSAAELSDIENCKKKILSGIDNTECLIGSNKDEDAIISDEVNERRDNCPCIMCDDKSISENEKEVLKNSTIKVKNKIKVPKVKDGDVSKSRKKSNRHNKNRLYESEISGDPESTSIKIKIKLTPTTSKNKTAIEPIIGADINSLNVLHNRLPTVSVKNLKISKQKRCGKRRSADMSQTSLLQMSSLSEGPKKKCKSKNLDPTLLWGPIPHSVKGEPQSVWGYKIATEILEKIFLLATYSQGCIPFLLRMSKVCRLWHDVAISPRLWHTVDLAVTTGLVKPRSRNERKLLWLIENRLSQVEDLNLEGWTEAVSPLMLRRISEVCPKLRSLNVGFCYKLHGENIHSLLFSSTNLSRLDLTGIMGTHKPTPRCAVGQQTLSELSSSLNKKLTHLTIARNTLSNVPSIISSLSEHCSNLQILDLSSVETIGRDSVRLDIEKLQKGCPKLRVLRLAYSLFRLCHTSMSVQASSPGFPELEELSVAVDGKSNMGMNDTELERILRNSNKLRLLDVRGCLNVTDSSLVRIPPWDLEHLLMAGASTPKSYSDRLELVIRKWQHSLAELDLSWTSNSDAIDSALHALSEETNENLRILNLCGSSMNFEPVRKILDNCPYLERLNLTSCRALPRGVKRLYENVMQISKLKESIRDGKFDEPTEET